MPISGTTDASAAAQADHDHPAAAHHPREQLDVGALDRDVEAIDHALEQRLLRVPAFGARTDRPRRDQPARRQHRRQREAHEHRHRDRERHRQPEALEETPDDAAHEGHRHEHREQRQRRRQHRQADLARGRDRRLFRAPSPFPRCSGGCSPAPRSRRRSRCRPPAPARAA